MGKIIGIGGVFLPFKGENQAVQDWYAKALGLPMTSYGTGFLEGEQLMLMSFTRADETMPFINLRVDKLDEIIPMLEKYDAEVGAVSDYDYGRFVRFTDPFGNKVELWEPNQEAYRAMVKEELAAYQERRGQSNQSSD